MLVLALDTATPYLVLGLPQAERALRLGRRHAEVLWAELETFLRQAGVARAQIEGIAVGQGPGSYTGLRVAVSAGLGLARGLGVPLVGVDTLQGVALRYPERVTIAHTTRNGLCYAATFEGGQPRTPANKAVWAELEAFGPLSLDEPPSGRALARLGQQALAAGQRGLQPVYL